LGDKQAFDPLAKATNNNYCPINCSHQSTNMIRARHLVNEGTTWQVQYEIGKLTKAKSKISDFTNSHSKAKTSISCLLVTELPVK